MLLPQPESAYKQVDFEKAAAAKDKPFSFQGNRNDRQSECADACSR